MEFGPLSQASVSKEDFFFFGRSEQNLFSLSVRLLSVFFVRIICKIICDDILFLQIFTDKIINQEELFIQMGIFYF